MIYYNFRYQGPYEYDKFILNYYQFYNEVQHLIAELEASNDDGVSELARRISVLTAAATDEANGFNNILLKTKLKMR